MTIVERMARAMEEAEFDWSITLVSLVDGVHTYELRTGDSPPVRSEYRDDLSVLLAQRKRSTQALASLEAVKTALAEHVDGMKGEVNLYDTESTGVTMPLDVFVRAMIQAAIDEHKRGTTD